MEISDLLKKTADKYIRANKDKYIAKGEKLGMANAFLETAKRMLKDGFSIEKIMHFVVYESCKDEIFCDELFGATCSVYWEVPIRKKEAKKCLDYILDKIDDYTGEARNLMFDLFHIFCVASWNIDDYPSYIVDDECLDNNYDPNQPRVEKGNPHGGEWKSTKTDEEIIEERREYLKSDKQNKKIERGQQNKHIKGTNEYKQYQSKLSQKGLFGPSYLTISFEEAQELIDEYCGTGEIGLTAQKVPFDYEVILDNDKIVGIVFNNLTGKGVETSVFKIHYGRKGKGTHLVPDYPSKKVNKKMVKDSQEKDIIDFWDYMHKKVKITLKDGKIFIGYAVGFDVREEGDDIKDAIEITEDYRKGYIYVLDRDDIASIEEIKED